MLFKKSRFGMFAQDPLEKRVSNLEVANDIKSLWENITGNTTGTITVYQRQPPNETEIIQINLVKWMLGEDALVVPVEDSNPTDKGAVKDANGKVVLADINALGNYVLHIGYDVFDDPIPPTLPLSPTNYALIWQIKGIAKDTFIIPSEKEVKDFDSDPAFVRDPDNNQIIAVHYGDNLNMKSGGFLDSVRNSDVLYVNRIEEKKDQVITVAKNGGDFTTIQGAIDSITDAGPSKVYVIKISPGVYIEDVVNKSFVYFDGSGALSTILDGTLVLGQVFSGKNMSLSTTITTSKTIIDASTNAGGQIELIDFSISVITNTPNVKPLILSVNKNSLYLENFAITYTNTSNSAVSSDTILVDLQGGGFYVLNQSAFNINSNQSSGNIKVVNDNNQGVTSTALIIGLVTMSNASWNSNISFINQINNSSNQHALASSDIKITGGGLGFCKAMNNNSGGALSTIESTRIAVNGFTENCICNAENVGDIIDFTYSVKNIEINWRDAFCGLGTINRIYRNDGTERSNLPKIDENRVIGDPTNDSDQDMYDITANAGWVSGQEITDNLDSTTTVALGTGFVRISNDEQSSMRTFDIAEFANQSYSVGENILYVDYNAGSPIVATTTNIDSIFNNENDKYELATVVKESDGTLHISRIYHRAKNVGARAQEWVYGKERFQRADAEGGWIISESGDGNRYVACTGGKGTIKYNKIPLTNFNTAITGSFDRYYSDGAGGFTKQVGTHTIWDNTQYDDGSGTLALVGVAKYSWQDMYRDADDEVVFMYGNNTFNSVASASIFVAYPIPVRLQKHAKFVGRIVFLRNATIAAAVLSPFITQLSSVGSVSTHNNLAGLQGGVAGEYYHLDNADYTNISTNTQLAQLKTTGNPIFNQINTGNVRITGNTIASLLGDLIFTPTGNLLLAFGGQQSIFGGNVNISAGNLNIGTVPTTNRQKLSIVGADSSIFGPHQAVYTLTDLAYPVFHQVNWAHDNIAQNFDAYWDGSNSKSSDVGSNYQIIKNTDKLIFRFESGIAQGSNITWKTGMQLDTTGNVVKPNHSSFLARRSAVSNVIGGSATYTVKGFTEIIDKNLNFTPTTGVFTAPILGQYQLNVSALLSGMDSSNTYSFITINTSNRAYVIWEGDLYGARSSAGNWGGGGSQLADMDALDVAVFNIYCNGNLVVDIITSNTTFSGFLES